MILILMTETKMMFLSLNNSRHIWVIQRHSLLFPFCHPTCCLISFSLQTCPWIHTPLFSSLRLKIYLEQRLVGCTVWRIVPLASFVLLILTLSTPKIDCDNGSCGWAFAQKLTRLRPLVMPLQMRGYFAKYPIYSHLSEYCWLILKGVRVASSMKMARQQYSK